MRRVSGSSRLRRRLAVTFAFVAAASTGMLALGTYLIVREARLDDAIDRSVEQTRANLLLAGAVLRQAVAQGESADLLAFYAGRAGFETGLYTEGEWFSSTLSLDATHVPAGVQRLVRQGDVAFERIWIAHTPYLVAGGRPPESETELYFFFSEEALRDDLAQLRTILLVGWVVVVVLSAAAGLLVARRVLRPVAQASKAAHALAEGLLETRLPVETDDELGAWAASFNEMAEALEGKIRALSEAQARERRFTADVAHELRTPLTALAGEAALLAEHLQRIPPEARRPAQLLVADIDRLRRLVEELLEISRLDAGREDVRPEPVDLGVLASGLLQSRGWETSVTLDAEAIVVETDPRRAERILANLVENALAHGGHDVGLRIRRNGSDALVEIRDRGPGMTPDALAHAFERFYKADQARAGRGSGLGLSIALENARLLGGGIDAWSEPGDGSRFTLRLPVAKPLRGGTGADEGARDDVAR
jgi:two-component system sensor histidine kinase MtrB